MTINESMVNKALSYDTSWQLINNDTGQSVSNSNGSATNSSFKLINPVDEDEYASLQLNYVNKVQTAPLKISKNVVDEDGSTPYDTDQSLTSKLRLTLTETETYMIIRSIHLNIRLTVKAIVQAETVRSHLKTVSQLH